MSRKQLVELTNMCMIYDDDCVLVQNRRSSHYPGVTFPGGHIEAGESLTDAVIREVYEETGLTISSPRLCGVKDWFEEDGSRYIVLLYKMDCYQGTLKSSQEGDVYWVRRSELPGQPLAQDMQALVRVFEEETLGEAFYEKVDGAWVMRLQ